MNYLLMTLEYFPFKGGVANYYTNLFHYWPKTSNLYILNNNEGQLINNKWPIKWLASFVSLYNNIKKNKIKHVIVGHILPLGTVAMIYSLFFKTSYSLILHGMDLSFALKNPRKRFIAKLVLRRARKIICANSFVYEKLLEIDDSFKNKSKVVNPGVKFLKFDNTKRQDQLIDKYQIKESINLISIGRLVKRKGVDNSIVAIANILDKNPDLNIKYLVVGEGPDKEYLYQVVRDNIKGEHLDRIIFTNEINEEDKWLLLDSSHIFIMPSRNIAGDYEGFGIVYLEANLSNLPVIAGNSGGVKDAVLDNVNGLLVDPESIDDISSKLELLIRDENLRLRIGTDAKKRALSDFNWRNQVELIYNFLTNL